MWVIKKLGVKLTISQKDELQKLFESKRKQSNEVAKQIESLDRKIDEKVFDLYGLTEEERGIVLSGSST